ncbi:unnamed protein product, partial [Rotaria sp. Silwood2]
IETIEEEVLNQSQSATTNGINNDHLHQLIHLLKDN